MSKTTTSNAVTMKEAHDGLQLELDSRKFDEYDFAGTQMLLSSMAGREISRQELESGKIKLDGVKKADLSDDFATKLLNAGLGYYNMFGPTS